MFVRIVVYVREYERAGNRVALADLLHHAVIIGSGTQKLQIWSITENCGGLTLNKAVHFIATTYSIKPVLDQPDTAFLSTEIIRFSRDATYSYFNS
nr:hypothetical protein CFP56_09707 [Quercus suber]